MNYKPSEIRTLSMLGQRGAFGVTLDNFANDNTDIFALSADLKNTSGLDRFAKNHPDRFVNVGIAEQNLIGIAAGLADSGFNVFASTFANFAALRACEFVRHFMGYMKSPIKLVGFGAGYAMEFFGNTHYGIEDISALRAISNLTVISPADGLETVKVVEALSRFNQPVYLRLTGMSNIPIVYKNDYDYQIGKAIDLKSGKDVCLIACGSMVAYALKAADLLVGEGISCAVLNMHTIKPLDETSITAHSDNKLIVTVEEHSTIGGLGSAVAECLSEKANTPRLLRLGISPGYKKAGGYKYMLEQNGLTAEQIADSIRKNIMCSPI
jgi:transketolase